MFAHPTNEEGIHGKVSIIGLDLAKRRFQMHGARADGGVAFRKTLWRDRVLAFLAERPPCVVAMEACGCQEPSWKGLIGSWCKRRGDGAPDDALAGWCVATVWGTEGR